MIRSGLFQSLLLQARDSLRDLAPVVLVVAFFQIVVLRQPLPPGIALGDLLIGGLCVLVGLTLFIRGLELGLFPVGQDLAEAFVRRGSALWLLLFAFALGFGSTVAEPALIAVSAKAAGSLLGGEVGEGSQAARQLALELRLVVACAVGTAVVLGVLRILRGWALPRLIIAGYLLAMVLTLLAPAEIIGIAYDSGGVTTSTITVPLVTALGVGLASAIKGRNPMLDGFGLIAFASVMPILFVLIWGSLRLPGLLA